MQEPLDTDVAIVGAGVVGCAIARELSHFDLRVTLLEAGPDVGAGTSKANTALLHTGFDAKPGTLEARLVPRGFELLSEYAGRVGIPVERTGALLVAWNEEQLAEVPGLEEGDPAEAEPLGPGGQPEILDGAGAGPQIGVGEGGPAQDPRSRRAPVATDHHPQRRFADALELQVEQVPG